jgi:serine protease SohB
MIRAMDILWETLGFAAKSALVLVTVAGCALVLLGLRRGRRQSAGDGVLEVSRLDRKLRLAGEPLRRAAMKPKAYKARHKELARAEQRRAEQGPRAYVLDFEGDVLASAVERLRHEVTAVLAVAGPEDEVILRLDSAGGLAHAYGLAASQLGRLRERGVRLTVCIDRVAASGGYLMACTADHIVAAPFAIVGSIGVVAPLPNLHRLLDRHGVDFENVTAGPHKRVVSFLAKNTDEGRARLRAQLEETHALFKELVARHRPTLDLVQAATGEHWHASRARELGLVDRLATSDEVLLERSERAPLYEVRYRLHQSWPQRLAGSVTEIGARVLSEACARLAGLP